MIGGRYMATKIDAVAAPQLARTTGLAGLFNRQVSAIRRPSDEHKPIRATGPSGLASTPLELSPATEKVEQKEIVC
jgi:hypothetical protein